MVEDNILDENYARSFLDNIGNNIDNVLENSLMFNNVLENSTILNNIEEPFTLSEIVKEQEDREKEMNNIIDERNRNLSDYSNKYKNLLEKTVNFIDTTNKNNKYSGKNIKFSNGIIGYVTEKGYFKYYTNFESFQKNAGKNGCPKEVIELNISVYNYNKVGEIIPTNPPLIVGTPMEINQRCGNEGKNLQVTSIQEKNSPFTYLGCFKSIPMSNTKMKYQSDLLNNSTFTTCKTRANDLGFNLMAMHNGNNNGSECYIGNNLEFAKTNETATKRNISYKLLNNNVYNNNKLQATLMKNGQIAIGPKGSSESDWKVTRFENNSNCDKKRGAFINVNNTIANFGVNCNGKIQFS